jgi:hypothetical protein
MFRSARFRNFKSLKDFTIGLRQVNVLVGPNNAGKSTILDAFRILSVALGVGFRRNPSLISLASVTLFGWEIPESQLPISLANVHSDYDPSETWIEFTSDNGKKLRLTFHENTRCVMTAPDIFPRTGSTSKFKRAFPYVINSFPTLGPFEGEEDLLSVEYVKRWAGSRRTPRLFRNIWHQQEHLFPAFRALVEATWGNEHCPARGAGI